MWYKQFEYRFWFRILQFTKDSLKNRVTCYYYFILKIWTLFADWDIFSRFSFTNYRKTWRDRDYRFEFRTLKTIRISMSYVRANFLLFSLICKRFIIIQPFPRFTYATAHSPTLPLLHLRHRSFSNPSFASPTSQDFYLCQLARVERPLMPTDGWQFWIMQAHTK